MNLLDVQNRIIELLSRFVTQVKGANSIGRTDFNRVSEIILIPLFSEIYGLTYLRSLNETEKMNFPGIDLGDDNARVAFQITATSSLDKIKDTLQKFLTYELDKKYDRLIIYILTEKQKSYSERAINDIIGNRITFSVEQDILDYRDILKEINGYQIEKAKKIQKILEANFSEGDIVLYQEDNVDKQEVVLLNFLELFVPKTIYLAELDLEAIFPGLYRPIETKKTQKKQYLRREDIQRELKNLGIKFAVDWEFYENKIITFHDLNDESLSLSRIIDRGTITPLETEEFYENNGNYERVFKSLLGRCLQQKLFHQQVQWQYEEKIFIFTEVDDQPTRIENWQGKVESHRTVYERTMKTNKPDEILNCKHFAFSTQYKRFGKQWYLVIKPDWFFSFDGYKRSPYGDDKISWLKRRERNQHVYNHLRFITYFLKNDKPSDLFIARQRYPFLEFGNLVSFDNAHYLDDKDWNPPADSDSAEDDGQGSFFLHLFDL